MAIQFNGSAGDRNPEVLIVMGSDSDWPVMKQAGDVLREFDISFKAVVSSAHRMPEETATFARNAYAQGVRVIIAGAGGAAHLPGVIAALTEVPVIGVPISLKNLDGLDSLLSIVQMPSGIPVATVSIDGAMNAGILAARILGAGDNERAMELHQKLTDFATNLKAKALAKGEALSE